MAQPRDLLLSRKEPLKRNRWLGASDWADRIGKYMTVLECDCANNRWSREDNPWEAVGLEVPHSPAELHEEKDLLRLARVWSLKNHPDKIKTDYPAEKARAHE
jgi:hypothetical protein